MPIKPANRQITTASIKNCPIMIRLVAPMAFLTPISLVRSFTETNIIFIIPIPPTTSDSSVIKIPVPPIAIFKVVYCFSKALVWFMAKSFFSFGFKPRMCRITDVTSSKPSSILSDGTFTLSLIQPLLENILLYAPSGRTACLSMLKRPKNFPCFSKTPITLNFIPSILICLPIGF